MSATIIPTAIIKRKRNSFSFSQNVFQDRNEFSSVFSHILCNESLMVFIIEKFVMINAADNIPQIRENIILCVANAKTNVIIGGNSEVHVGSIKIPFAEI